MLPCASPLLLDSQLRLHRGCHLFSGTPDPFLAYQHTQQGIFLERVTRKRGVGRVARRLLADGPGYRPGPSAGRGGPQRGHRGQPRNALGADLGMSDEGAVSASVRASVP